MKEKLDQLEILLNEIYSKLEINFQVKSHSVSELQNIVNEIIDTSSKTKGDLNEGDFSDVGQRLLKGWLKIKDDQSIINIHIPRLKSLLTANLEKVSTINNGTFSDTRFGSKSKGPNMEFIKLLSQKLLTPSSTIYATCNSVRYEGSLSLDGYFNLFIENSEKPFSSLSTAASFISNKPIQKGWLFWFATDKDGKEQKMEYFKKQLT